MPRILADLPDSDIEWLDRLAAERGISRAELIRQAIASFREKDRDWVESGFGLWTRYGQGVDGGEYEAAARAELATGGKQ